MEWMREWKQWGQVGNYFCTSVWFMHCRQIRFLIKQTHTATYTSTHIMQTHTVTAHGRLCPRSKKDKGEASHTWTYWDWPQLQLPGAAGLICWQGPQRLHCGLRHWESACARHVGSWGMMEEWEIRVSAPGWQEVGLSEPLAVVLLGPESARKRDEKYSKKKKKTDNHNQKCHMRDNMELK